MIRKWLSAVSLLFGITPAAFGAEGSGGLTAVLTQLDGAVQLTGPGVERAPRAKLWQVVRTGVTVRVPEGGAAGIVCSNYRFVRLRGPESWSLSDQTCAIGKELTPGEYALIAPQAGRFKVLRGLLTLTRVPRLVVGGQSLAPVALSPRETTVQSPRPTASWSRVPSAVEYRVTWSGRRIAGYDTLLKAEDVTCAPLPGGVDACVQPWPPDRPDLPPDESFSLQIAARGGIADSWHWSDSVDVQTQRLSAASALKSRLQGLENIGLEGSALQVARAGLLAGEDLYADAAEAYRRALALAHCPELRVTLADVYLSVGLHPLAETLYREALTESVPAVRAAATFGLGRIEYDRRQYDEAVAAFRQAREGYAAMNLDEEETAARQAEERAAAEAAKKRTLPVLKDVTNPQ
jgi:hypothetical protein